MRDVGVICTVARNGEGYSVQNVKRYDVWGGVRSDSGASSSASGGHLANTDKRYCANLGHASDIETGLIYMRARYYEPTTGRFISEDPARDGRNWYIYCNNVPTTLVDSAGRMPHLAAAALGGAFIGFMTAVGSIFGSSFLAPLTPREMLAKVIAGVVGGALGGMAAVLGAGAIGGGMVAGAITTALDDALSGKGFNLSKILLSAGMGGAMGGACRYAIDAGFKQWVLTRAIDDEMWLDVMLGIAGGLTGDGILVFTQ